MEFLDLVYDCFLIQYAKGNTRGSNILDLVFTTEPGLIDYMVITAPIASSDHHLLNFKVIWKRDEIIHKNDCFNYQKGDYVTIRKCLANICWEEKFEGKTVDEMSNIFKR